MLSSGRSGGAPGDGEAAFTLLETLAALAILAISLVSLYDAHSRGLRAAVAAGAYAEARILAQALLADAQTPRGRAPAARQGREGRFYWSVDAWTDPAGLPALIRLEVVEAQRSEAAVPPLVVAVAADAELTCLTDSSELCSLNASGALAAPAEPAPGNEQTSEGNR